MKYSIYQLIDPRDNLPHYLGFTRNVDRRLYEHIRGDGSGNALKEAWIDELISCGMEPILQEIEIVTGTLRDAVEREIGWIHFFAEKEAPLTNSNGLPSNERATTFYLPPELHRWLKAYAAFHEKSMSDVVVEELEALQKKHPLGNQS